MSITALMPMKGVSERVPNKNMRLFNGKPLCSYMLNRLSQSEVINRVVVNTDSCEIAEYIQNEYPRVIVLQRPAHLLGHDVSMNKIIQHDLTQVPGDIFIQTHSTNPLLKLETIEAAVSRFSSFGTDYDSMFSVTEHQTRFYNSSGNPINHDPETLIKTQDLPCVYEENSCFYLFTRASFKKRNRRIGQRPYMMAIHPFEAVDIDVEAEFNLAEKLHQIL